MIIKPEHFDLQELVCPHVFYKYGERAWAFFDAKLFIILDWIRDRYGPVFLNDWFEKYKDSDYIKAIAWQIQKGLPVLPEQLPVAPEKMLDERGLRCNICSLYLEKTPKGIIYMSGHGLAKAGDLTVQGRIAEEVRQDVIKNKTKLPFPIRFEKDKSWIHIDCEDNFTGEKVTLFEA